MELLLGLALGAFISTVVTQWLERRRGDARYDGGMLRMDTLLAEERGKNVELLALLQSERPQDFAAWKAVLDRPDPEPEQALIYLYDDSGFLVDTEVDHG